MSIYFANLEVSSCEISGFVAAALLHDLRINNFTFNNFPEVDVAWDNDKFHITLKVQGSSSSTFSFDYKTVNTEVNRFRDKKKPTDQVFDVIQQHVAELESIVSKTKIS